MSENYVEIEDEVYLQNGDGPILHVTFVRENGKSVMKSELVSEIPADTTARVKTNWSLPPNFVDTDPDGEG